MTIFRVLSLFALLSLGGCYQTPAADSDWRVHGHDASEQRHSPLKQINPDNVASLGLAWEQSTDSQRGVEATPIVSDGVMFTTSTWSRVIALDALSGEVLWRYDPKVPKAWAKRLCCDIVNRGVAVSHGKVLFGTLDGRLIALDANSGQLVWEINTLTDRDQWYSITGAPRVVGDKVIIGNGGAEYSVRGYVSAYDIQSGDLLWRFFTVPASADGPHEHAGLAEAAKTWDAKSNWQGAGGTVWDSMAYDAELNLLYVGTGNGSPWPRYSRSPSGGDNLYLSSILALRPGDGSLIWHYQTTPGDNWDYTATQHMILADLEIQGRQRKVLMQAPKNGFFYVLDRQTGELISAEKYVFTNWASHVDIPSGRPQETGRGDYSKQDTYVFPSPAGGHNWHPMAYNQDTGLVYFSARDIGWVFNMAEDKWFTYGVDNIEELIDGQTVPETSGYLKAWNPVTQKLQWQQSLPNIWNGGVLSTGGGLVFHGTATGDFYALKADNGEVLKKIEVGTGIIAPPISYSINGEQYITVMAGWGGPAFNTLGGDEALLKYGNSGRILTFKLGGGKVSLPERVRPRGAFAKPPKVTASKDDIGLGKSLYIRNCGSCHGMHDSVPMLPDLRRMSPATQQIFKQIVLAGAYETKGMPGFADELNENEAEAIQQYIVWQANKAYSAQTKPPTQIGLEK